MEVFTPMISDGTTFQRVSGYFREAAERSVGYVRPNFRLIGLVGLISIPSAYFVAKWIWPEQFESFLLRTLAGLLCLPFIVDKRMPIAWERVLPSYWCLCCGFIFPFYFALVLVTNAALTPVGQETELIWIANYLIGLFLFVQLMNNVFLATTIWVVASAFVVVSVGLIEDPNWGELRRVFFYFSPAYFTAVVIGSLTLRNIELVHRQKIEAVAALGSNIAHELRTPLLGIKARSRGTVKHLSQLVEGYEWAVRNGAPLARIEKRRVNLLRVTLEDIEAEADYANTIINMLLFNSSYDPLFDNKYERFPASACAREAVQRYPYNNRNERDLVSLEVQRDFDIFGPRLLVVHVLLNLLKNAVYHVQHHGTGKVRIIVGGDGAEIVVGDTGPGIPPEVHRRIFDPFFTTTRLGVGSGIGLSFSKLVMTKIGGTIECKTEVGLYSNFVLRFSGQDHHLSVAETQ